MAYPDTVIEPGGFEDLASDSRHGLMTRDDAIPEHGFWDGSSSVWSANLTFLTVLVEAVLYAGMSVWCGDQSFEKKRNYGERPVYKRVPVGPHWLLTSSFGACDYVRSARRIET